MLYCHERNDDKLITFLTPHNLRVVGTHKVISQLTQTQLDTKKLRIIKERVLLSVVYYLGARFLNNLFHRQRDVFCWLKNSNGSPDLVSLRFRPGKRWGPIPNNQAPPTSSTSSTSSTLCCAFHRKNPAATLSWGHQVPLVGEERGLAATLRIVEEPFLLPKKCKKMRIMRNG